MMKWKRQEPGHYVSGTYHVKGTGTNWDLYKGRKHLYSGSSKKECQKEAEKYLSGERKVEKESAPAASKGTGFSPKGQPTLDDLHGVMTSLYLEMTHVSAAMAQLSHYIKEEAESKDRLAKAILLLGRHVGKLGQ
jgi:hypothetical protein